MKIRPLPGSEIKLILVEFLLPGMIVILGLGNPGKKYQKTRHNIGFRVVEEFAKENNFPSFRVSKKIRAEISEGTFDNEKIILAKPQTFMNLSGKSVKKLTCNLQLTTDNLWVVHDDIDLPLGKIKIAISRGAAGHKGVESIIKELKTKKFVRFRIGVNHETCNMKHETAEKFVLEKFSKKEEKIVGEVIKKTMQAIEIALGEGVEKAQSTYNICARPST